MKYFSTNRESQVIDFREATIKGQPDDKGLFFPVAIPQVEKELLNEVEGLANEEIAFRVIKPYIGDTISEESLFEIVAETVNFPIPLIKVTDDIYSLELFHGPTLAFKDVGARFMSRCLSHFVKDRSEDITILVATSGDTGGAVANGFYDVEGVNVIILYPSGKVSPVQEKQLTTLGKNIHALEVKGNFDDCQRMVKQAFADTELNQKLRLTSANSINVARWLPQQFYYFFAYKQWLRSGLGDQRKPPVISVPSGNFGNICAGILAWSSALPVKHFIAACNSNDVVSDYLRTEILKPKQTAPTLSNAMDVGDPSNFVRILEIFNHRFPDVESMLSSYTISDEETLQTIKEVFRQYNYTCDPHGAVGFLSLQRWLNDNPGNKGYFIETAHPVKFPDAVEEATGINVELPFAVKEIMQSEKRSTIISPRFEELKDLLLK
ncbi:MAG: threonine synthase [Chitinophagaceae bacterium]|nr:threonine synthase [Chitinophagaceae bacterium]